MPSFVARFRMAMILIAAVTASSAAATYAQNADLKYQPASGQQFGYEIEITVDQPSKITTFKGITRYTVNSVNSDQISLTYRGGLGETSKSKSTGGGRPFGPGGFGPFGPGFGPGGPPDPFSRPAFGGKTQTTNRITLTTRGGVLAMEGDSQLPFLLGNVSLLPFEILPDGNERQWKYDTGISIEQTSENRGRSFGPFGPSGRFGPFGPSEDKKSQSGQEAADYSIQSQDDQKVVVKKTYRLKKPAVGDDPALEITGDGTWTFNRKDRMPEGMDFKQKLVIAETNTQTTVPISISIRRMTAEAIAKIDQEAQQRLKEMEQKAAADKQKAEAPLTPAEKQNAIQSLAGSDAKKITETLAFLKGKSVKDPDADVAAAIQKLLEHPNTKIRDEAKAAMRRWSPDFDRRIKLNEAYAGHMPVESTDREVNSTTPLYVGQIVQYQEHGSFWHAGEVLELLSDGKVKIKQRGFAPREATVARRNIQLAPDEVDQPRKPATLPSFTSSVASTGGTRIWTDASGEHKIEAAFISFADGKVTLKKSDNKVIAVPLDKLSAEDQQIAQKLQASKKTPNPFE